MVSITDNRDLGAARWIVAAFAVRPLERSEADHVARRRALHHQIAQDTMPMNGMQQWGS